MLYLLPRFGTEGVVLIFEGQEASRYLQALGPIDRCREATLWRSTSKRANAFGQSVCDVGYPAVSSLYLKEWLKAVVTSWWKKRDIDCAELEELWNDAVNIDISGYDNSVWYDVVWMWLTMWYDNVHLNWNLCFAPSEETYVHFQRQIPGTTFDIKLGLKSKITATSEALDATFSKWF